MATLQKVNLGTPPTAVDGDTSRGANTKANANVDVLNAQAALTSAAATITSAQALTSAHVGKRVNINLAAAGTINVPSAATMGLDGIVHLRNTGSTLVTLAIASGSGDTIAVTKLNSGESVILDSDGSHAIGCLLRGRTNSDNETVNGNSTVTGNEIIGGTLTVAGQAFNPPANGVAYTPSISTPSGAFSNVSRSGFYVQVGKLVFFTVYISLISVGTATGISVGLPTPAAATGITQVVAGRETATTGKMLQGQIQSGASTMSVFAYDNSIPLTNGYVLSLSGVYLSA